MSETVAIIGGGLAGCECALVLARAGIAVHLYEQKPRYHSSAHVSHLLAELVCSNSLRSKELTSGVGLLKEEMRQLQSPFMAAADATQVPADKALAVDRTAFSQILTERVRTNAHITLHEQRIESVEDPIFSDAAFAAVVVAAGPLASENFVESLSALLGATQCYFYDAIAPIVWTNSLNHEIVFRSSRYDCEQNEPKGEGDYLNCPMNKEEYTTFYEALMSAKTVPAREFEQLKHFEGCMPIEEMASRGFRTLTFGPLKPVGFIDPRSQRRPYALLQLRAENLSTDTCNLVGCQTRMLQAEQSRVFRLIPGMEQAEFVRYGSMHRNTYVNAPEVLAEDLSLKKCPHIFLAGQITGVEGYVESAACGLWAAQILCARIQNRTITEPPAVTALGALLRHLRSASKKFQPSNIHFGLMPAPEMKLPKKERKEFYAQRAQAAFAAWKNAQRLC